MRGDENSVYVIDPDEAVHDALNTLLGASGYRVACYRTAESFFESDSGTGARSGCVFVEAELPGMGSLAFIRRARAQSTNLPIIVLTSTSDRDIANQARRAGAMEVLEKPLIDGQLLDRLRALRRRSDDATQN